MRMCQQPKVWESFCTRIGRPDLAADARFAATDARFANREALTFALDSHLVQQPTNHWLQVLGGHVPVAPVYDIAEALDSDYVQANGMIETVDHPDSRGGKLRTLASPIKVNGARLKSRRAPKLGEM
jgi:crotonobetainyl-CoA:carnitine CoA-transferase CaiB-like acyl-CoA transferase